MLPDVPKTYGDNPPHFHPKPSTRPVDASGNLRVLSDFAWVRQEVAGVADEDGVIGTTLLRRNPITKFTTLRRLDVSGIRLTTYSDAATVVSSSTLALIPTIGSRASMRVADDGFYISNDAEFVRVFSIRAMFLVGGPGQIGYYCDAVNAAYDHFARREAAQ